MKVILHRRGTNWIQFRVLAARVTILLFPLVAPASSRAAWPSNPNINVPLCTAAGNQRAGKAIPDGAGGAIIAWEDSRGALLHIYIQSVNAAGVPRWTPNGVEVYPATSNQFYGDIVSDGAGGAIVTWQDALGSLDYDIYAQRVSAAGEPLWATSRLLVCGAPGDQDVPRIISDGAGGAVISWYDGRNSSTADIYAQRVNAAGVRQWTVGGVALCTAPNDQFNETMESDGAGGAIVAWEDDRSGTTHIYAQRVNATGAPQWTADGVALCTAANGQSGPTIASDDAGGAIVTWNDGRNADTDIYAQRVNAAGVPQWPVDGVPLSTAAGNQDGPAIVSDGAGGSIVTWYDLRGADWDIYAQRVNATGVPQWTANGVALCTSPNDQIYATIASDGVGGAIVTWQDGRSGTDNDIFAQRVNAAGVPQWPADGVALCTATRNQDGPAITPDAAGGAIVAWTDERNGSSGSDVYVQNVNADGSLGGDQSVPVLGSLVSADALADHVSLEWYDPHSSAATVYRASAPGNWQAASSVLPDGSNLVHYDDYSVVPGERYGYRLGVTVSGEETLVGEVWVTVPAAVSFGLRGAHPNPSAADVTVTFSLLDDSPATLEIYELSGRRVAAVSVGGLGSGTHVLSLSAEARTLHPGLYALRLTQGSRRASTKLAIVR
ncbi:MAG: T9SS type A sorting domain-containing protein [Candidatus Eisenbacteria bacterium]|nr:T9SS type A sorting domain-containing protein [Candidatus Eisenbacteria bacterium]